MASIRGTQGSGRLLVKLHKLINNGEYYEAHQLYRTLNFRYSNSGKFAELRKLLLEGANLFLGRDQHNSGADLALMYLDALNKDTKITEVLTHDNNDKVIYQNIGQLFARIPANTTERMQFTVAALKLETSVFDISLIHNQFALILWKEKNYPESRYHFLRSPATSGDECARMLIEYQVSCGSNTETDLFIAQFILQLLCLRTSFRMTSESIQNNNSDVEKLLSLDNVQVQSLQHAYASKALQSFTTRHPRIRQNRPPYAQPLLNFLWLLLIAIDGGKSNTFKTLCDLYATALSRDPSYKQYLVRIGELYFGMKQPARPQGLQGIFGNLLQSLMEDMDDSDDSSTPVAGPPPRSQPTPRKVEADNDLD